MALLAALHLLVVVGLPAIDRHDPVQDHEAHFQAGSDTSCDPMHRDLQCLLCRAAATDPVAAAAVVAMLHLAPQVRTLAPDGGADLVDAAPAVRLRARAPPA